jgi:hypothetical protein
MHPSATVGGPASTWKRRRPRADLAAGPRAQSRWSYSSVIHSFGHSSTQAPQSVHSSSLITATSSTVIASTGHTSAHAPHAVQSSAFTFAGIHSSFTKLTPATTPGSYSPQTALTTLRIQIGGKYRELSQLCQQLFWDFRGVLGGAARPGELAGPTGPAQGLVAGDHFPGQSRPGSHKSCIHKLFRSLHARCLRPPRPP